MSIGTDLGDAIITAINNLSDADQRDIDKLWQAIGEALVSNNFISNLIASDGSPNPALSVDADGNVGIGTTTPDYKLEVSNDNSTPYIQGAFGNNVSGNNKFGGLGIYGEDQSHLRFWLNNEASGNPDWQIRVGSGTGADKFQIYSFTQAADILTIDGTDGNIEINNQVSIIGASRVRVTKNNAQTINQSTTTIIQYDDEDYDNLGEYDNSTNYRFTATEAGYYHVNAGLLFGNVSWNAGEYLYLDIYKNGTRYSALDFHEIENGGTQYQYLGGSDDIYLAASDYIDIRVYQTGASKATGTNVVYNHFSVHRLS